MSERAADKPRFPFLRATVVLAAGALYATSAVPFVLGGDSGEVATLYATGGIAHPPGFPTLVLWLRALHAVPWSFAATPAEGAALASALAGTLAVWMLQRACLAWGASGGAAAIASALFAFSKNTWLAASEAEAFALLALFAATLLVLSAPHPPWQGTHLTVALGMVAGLALGNHQTVALLAPVGLGAAIRSARAARRPWVARSLGLIALVTGTVLPYTYLYAVARTADPNVVPLWLEAPSLRGVWFHALRGAYGTFSLAPASVATARAPFTSLVRFTLAVGRDLLGFPLLVVIAATLALARLPKVDRHGSLVLLAVSFLLVGPAFAASMNLPPDGLGPTVAARFDVLPELVLCLLVALSIQALAPRVGDRGLAIFPATLAIAAVGVTVSRRDVAGAHRPDVAHFTDNVFATAPPRSIIVDQGDAQWGAFLYAHYAEQQRLDVVVVDPGLVRQAWYRHELTARLGASLETPEGKPVGPKTMLKRLLATGRPVFYTEWPDPSLAETPHDSYGPLMRVLPDDRERPTTDDLEQTNEALFATYALDLPPPLRDTEWGHALYGEYARAWGELGQRFQGSGRAARATACFARAYDLAPWSLQLVSPPP